MIRLYLEEDSMRRSLVRALRARGIDVITALDAGMIGRTVAEQTRHLLRLVASKSAADMKNRVEFLRA